MSTDTAPLSRLTEVSRKLNQKSNTLNKVISSLNTKLEAMNIGLEVWLDDPVESGDPYFTYAATDRDDEYPIPTRDVTLLGYARLSDRWQLAIKSAIFVSEQGRTGEANEEIKGSSQLRPLLTASREIRARAMGLIPDLLTVIANQAQWALDSIEKAEKAAEEL